MNFRRRSSGCPATRIEAGPGRRSLLLGAVAGFSLAAASALAQGTQAGSFSDRAGEASNRLSAVFEASDENGDGKLDRDETPVEFLHRFNDYDLDHDGSIDSFEAWEYESIARREAVAKRGASGADPVADQPVADQKEGETIRTLVELVGRLDANGDQRLSSDEIPDELGSKLTAFDLDEDGVLDLEEARTLDARREQSEAQPRPRTLSRLVSFMDTDGDGLLQKREAPLRLQRVFERFDRNGDGAIDLAEANAADDAARQPQP